MIWSGFAYTVFIPPLFRAFAVAARRCADFATEQPREIELVLKGEVGGNLADGHARFPQKAAGKRELAVEDVAIEWRSVLCGEQTLRL